MPDDKLIATIDNFGLAVQRALSRNQDASSQEIDSIIAQLTDEVNATIQALDRPGNTPTGEDPFDHYTDLINHLTADIATLRQADVVSDGRVQGLTDSLSTLSDRVDGLRVQTGPSDATPGALMSVGAFGIGTDTVPISPELENITDKPTGGLYSVVGAGSPFPIAAPIWNVKGAHSFAMAARGPSAWVYTYGQEPVLMELLHKQNVVGAVAQTGGVNTGAVIERGSNTNGAYIRYADGTQICYYTSPTIAGGTNNYVKHTWYYPAIFLTTPAITTSWKIENNWSYITAHQSAGVDSVTLFAFPEGIDATGRIVATAIGRWY